MNTKRLLILVALIGLFSQSHTGARRSGSTSLDTTKMKVEKVGETIFVELEGVETPGEKEKLLLAKELFPDGELVWKRTFNGRMTDCAIAAKSGHVVIGVVEDWHGFVYLFDLTGRLLWKKESSINSDIKKCTVIEVDISENGCTIGIMWFGDYERANTQVYDVSGERVFDRFGGAEIGSHIKISPQGGYIDCDWGLLTREGKEIELRKILQVSPPLKPKEGFGIPAFVLDSEIVVQIEGNNNLYFFSFLDGQLKWKSPTDMQGRIVTSENYILLGNSSKVTLFDKKGNLLWTRDLGASTFAFSEDESYIGTYGGGRGGGAVNIVNTKTGKLENSVKFSEGCVEQFPPYFLCLNNIIAVSGITGFVPSNKGKREGYYTYFLKLDKNRKIIEEGWRKGLVIGTSTTFYVGLYESDATTIHHAGGEESTKFTINIIKVKQK